MKKTTQNNKISKNLFPYRREFILIKNENLICEKCHVNNGMIKVTVDLKKQMQFLYFQCSSCNKREYFHILQNVKQITLDLLKEILKDQGFVIS